MKAVIRFLNGHVDNPTMDILDLVTYIVARNRSPKDLSEEIEKEKRRASVAERSAAGGRVITQWYNNQTGRKLWYKDIGKRPSRITRGLEEAV